MIIITFVIYCFIMKQDFVHWLLTRYEICSYKWPVQSAMINAINRHKCNISLQFNLLSSDDLKGEVFPLSTFAVAGMVVAFSNSKSMIWIKSEMEEYLYFMFRTIIIFPKIQAYNSSKNVNVTHHSVWV